jgi:uncharacterized Ntn-hydrolase superfamily protein
MHRCTFLAIVFLATSFASAATPSVSSPSIPVATYSIVARDPATGELGVAVQSHWFSVGAIVPWAQSGVGAVATQSFVEPSYGFKGLELMQQKIAARDALTKLVAADKENTVRQVAFVDALGRAAAYTGAKCIPGAGHHIGQGYTTQANLMLTDDVPDAMAKAFEAAKGPLAERMLAALDAGQAAGGDIRGRQSAAILVVRDKPSDKPWTDRLVDLRVDDNPQPLAEMRRLLVLHRAYECMNRGDEAVALKKMSEALKEYSKAQAMVPDNDEFVFWTAVTLVSNARMPEALPLFSKAFRMNPSWMLLIPRLVAVGQLPDRPGLADAILAVAPKADLTSK